MNEKMQLMLLVLLMMMSLKPAASIAAYCSVGEPFAYTAPYDLQECPPDIQAWMDRANGCADLDQKEKADPNLQAEHEEARFEMECEYLGCDYQAILAKYRGNGVLTNIIKAYKDIVYVQKFVLDCDEEFRPEIIQ